MRYTFASHVDHAGGVWAASCSHLECSWTRFCWWDPYADASDLAAFYLSAAEHEREPHPRTVHSTYPAVPARGRRHSTLGVGGR